MDHIGIDVHKRESQIYILAEGGRRIELGDAQGSKGSWQLGWSGA